MVAHEGATWLPRTLAALRSQSRLPDELVGVDTSSTDDSPRMIAAALGSVVPADPRAGFLDAVRAGVAVSDGDRLRPAVDPHAPAPSGPDPAGAQEWIWLLHDDSAPEPGALARLLDAVEVAPSIGIAGCKQRGWDDTGRLLQTGFTTSRSGRPLTGVEAGDVDQGQTDDRGDVLAVGTAGMLVRRDVWDALGGGDPALPVLGDDLDLCRRARLAGHRVVVVPGAVVVHADATRAGARTTTLLNRGVTWTRRRNAVHARLVAAPAALLPVTVLAVLAGGLARMVARIAAKQPGRAVGDLGATLTALARPDRIWRARRAAGRTRTVPRGTLRPLLASRSEVARFHRQRWQRRRAARAAVGEPRRTVRPTPGGWQTPALIVLGLAVVSALALQRLLWPGTVAGGALAAAPRSLGVLWESARSSWVDDGLGAPGPADPFLTVLAALTMPFGGRPSLTVVALLVLAIPAAGLGAWTAAGALTRSAWLRGWAALVWAAAPPLLLALDDGRLGPAVAHVALPWVALAVGAASTATSGRHAWTLAAAGSLAFAVAAAGSPVLLPAGVLTLGVLALGLSAPSRRLGHGFPAGRRNALALLWIAVPALVLCGPLLVAALDEPRLLVADPGRPTAWDAVPAWQVLLGRPAEAWPPPASGWLPDVPQDAATAAGLVASGVVTVLAVLALARRGRSVVAVRAGWVVAVLGLLAAIGASRVAVGWEEPGRVVLAWPGGGSTLLLAGLLVAALAGADGLRAGVRGLRRGAAAALAAVALVGPVAGLGAWAWRQADAGGALALDEAPRLPAVAADAASSPDRSRTLVLRSSAESVTATLARRDGERLDATSAAVELRRAGASDAAGDALARAVAALASGSEDPRPRLADLGVGFVLLRGGAERNRSDDAMLPAGSLDAVVGLGRAGAIPEGVLWRVSPEADPQAVDRAARAKVLGADGAPQAVLPAGRVDVRADVPAGETGRRVVLAERSDDGWRATLDGEPLAPAVHAGWAQAFELPAGGGRLAVEHDDGSQDAWALAQAGVLALTLLLAVPVGGTAARRQLS